MSRWNQPSQSSATTPLGIDMGSRTVKIVATEAAPGRIDIRAAGSIGIPELLVQNGVVTDPKRFGRTLAMGLDEMEIEPGPAVLSIPSGLAVLRWVNLPDLPPAELREAAKFKVRRHLPFPVEEAYIEATTPELDDNLHGQSLVIAVRREVIDSRAEAIEAAGLEPVRAELEAQAILRVVERRLNEQGALWKDATLTIIDIGATNTHMYVVQNQRLQFIRGVRFGSDRIARGVAESLGVPLHEAEQFLTHPETSVNREGTLSLRTGDLIARLDIRQELERLTKEFLRLLRYFRSLHPERSYAGILDHLLVCGGLAGLNGFADYLSAVLELRVELARPFAGMVARLNQETFQSIARRQEAFTVVVGLALSGLAKEIQIGGEANARSEFVWARSA